jgi:cellulose synthase/poly-beta-1,6-N-acetylglucosamine synthase-like glycosyltransferase
MIGFFDDPQMGAVTSFVTVRNSGKNLLTKLQTVEYLLLGWTRKILDFIDSVFVTNGPLSVYRKKFVEKVGGFDLTTVTEDIDITWNLLDHGYKTGMCLDARVTTIVPETFKSWWNQRIRWGVGGIQAIDKYKSSFFKRGIFGVFIIPFVTMSILVSIGAFLFSFYIVGRSFFVRVLTTGYSIASESSFIHFQELNLYPSVLFFFFIVLFASSFIYYGYILRRVEDATGLGTRKFFRLLFYMLVYLSLYSIVWFPSVYRFLRRDFRW